MLKQCCINVDATSWRCIDVDAMSYKNGNNSNEDFNPTTTTDYNNNHYSNILPMYVM